MIKIKNKNFIFVFLFLNILIYNYETFAKVETVKKILSLEDNKIYKQIFELQSRPIKNKNSWNGKKLIV